MKLLPLVFAVAAMAGCADVASTAPKTAAPTRISYSDITINTVPQGAAIYAGGRFFGYSPVVIHAKLTNDYLESFFVAAMPMGPGQFTQQGWIGSEAFEDKPYPSQAAYTLYMFNNLSH
jgi:hypothetical protein